MTRITRFVGMTLLLAVLFDSCNKETVAPAPSISSFLPTSAPTGASITIIGLNFNATIAGNTVKFNNIAALVTAATATSITATVPSGNTTGPITVTVGSQTTTSSSNFTLICNLKTYTSTSGGSSQTRTYEYNSDYRITKLTVTSGSGTVTITYALNSVGNATTRTIASSSGTSVYTYTYDSNNRMVTETNGSSTTTFTYNSGGQMTLATYSVGGNSVLTYPNTTTHNYSRETYTSSGVTIIDFEYDTKPNPFKTVFPWGPWETDNNVTKVSEGASVSNYAYTYNPYGYVVTVTGSGSSTLVGTLTYDCN